MEKQIAGIDIFGKFSPHLQQALDAGMVRIDDERATILMNEAQLTAARRAMSERTVNGKLLSFADLARMVEEEFDQSGLGNLVKGMPINARCICPLCGQGHDPKLIGDGGEGEDD